MAAIHNTARRVNTKLSSFIKAMRRPTARNISSHKTSIELVLRKYRMKSRWILWLKTRWGGTYHDDLEEISFFGGERRPHSQRDLRKPRRRKAGEIWGGRGRWNREGFSARVRSRRFRGWNPTSAAAVTEGNLVELPWRLRPLWGPSPHHPHRWSTGFTPGVCDSDGRRIRFWQMLALSNGPDRTLLTVDVVFTSQYTVRNDLRLLTAFFAI